MKQIHIRRFLSLLLAALIAVIDALPVFGTGTILIPWALALPLNADGWVDKFFKKD